MSKPAAYGRMASLHAKLAQVMEGMLDEALASDGLPLDAASIGTISKFLKDNEITCDPADKEDMNALREKFSRARRSGSVEQSIQNILEGASEPNELH